MPANPLLPPAGAEPGSVWLLVHEKRSGIPSVWVWSDGSWVPSWGGRVSAQMMGNAGYHLADPHGAAAAVAVLEAAGFSEYALERDEYHQCRVTLYKDECYPERVIEDGKHPTSFLAAALAAVREWEGRDG